MLIHDSQYTPADFPLKKGWGHSFWSEGIELAAAAEVKQYLMFHHDPDRTTINSMPSKLKPKRGCRKRTPR